MKFFIFRVYIDFELRDYYEVKVTAKNLSQAWRLLPGEILYLSHVRGISFIDAYEV